jgi:uncharacterized phage protein (predicted DNA packaging)
MGPDSFHHGAGTFYQPFESIQMTAPVSLDALKLHARIDGNAEDSAVASYLAAAIASVEQYLNLVDPLDDTAPAPVKSAILLMAAGLYANREDVADRQLYNNDTYYRLLAPYRVFS